MSHNNIPQERLDIALVLMERYGIPSSDYQQQEFIARHLSRADIEAYKASLPVDKVSEN